jgi:lysophospholipase L1-like esterase
VGGAAGGGAGGRGGAGGWTADGGGGAPADGGAADGGVAYDPCPKTGVCSIMPLGDSITYGVGSSGSGGGYRVPLFQLAVTASQHITFVGRNMNGPTTVAEQSFPQGHEGYSGYTIEDAPAPISRNGIYPLVDGAMSMFHPNIVLLMIGTNDVNQNNDLANAPTRLGQLIDKIVGDGPDALLVVAKIIPTGTDSTNVAVQTFNDAIPGVVATRVAAGKHVVVVDMYTPFAAVAAYRTALMSDNLHPNDTGYMAMAEAWYAVIRAYLPAM